VNSPYIRDNNDILKWIKYPFIKSNDLITIVKPTGYISMDMYVASLEYNSSPNTVKIDEYFLKPRKYSNIDTWNHSNDLGISFELELFLKSLFPYKISMHLLYKASNDGFDCRIFHQLCDNKGPTIVIVYTDCGKVIGGYTPLNWQTSIGEYSYVPDDTGTSFLFSFTLLKKFTLLETSTAICNSPKHGPKFGGGHDLEIVSNCNFNYNYYDGFGYSYNPEGITKTQFYGNEKFFLVKDYLVYQLSAY